MVDLTVIDEPLITTASRRVPSTLSAADLNRQATAITGRVMGPCAAPCDVEEDALCTGCAAVYDAPERC